MGKCALCAKNDANPFSRICYSGCSAVTGLLLAVGGAFVETR